MKISTVYFSATNTTKTILSALSRLIGDEETIYNLTNRTLTDDILLRPDDILLVGMPVYAGRIPSMVVESLKQFKGNHTPAILVAVYGNREFDDALVEMQDIVEPNGFTVVAAGAFIAQHSIFPRTAKGRPDVADWQKINAFAARCKDLLQASTWVSCPPLSLPGNRPYKTPGRIPLKVVTSSRCDTCGACIKACPVGAISPDDPHVTDPDKCIHCSRCIHICPSHARHYGGLLYHVAGWKFGRKNKLRKEPVTFFIGS